MNIIHVLDSLGVAGGVESFVYELCTALNNQGHSVSIIGILYTDIESNEEIQKLKNHGVNVVMLGADSKVKAITKYIGKLHDTIERIAKNKITMCNLHLKLSVLMGVIATRGIKNVYCVETYHSQYSHYLLEHTILSPFIKKYIACSESARQEMLKRFKTNEKKTVIILNGVNRESLRGRIEIRDHNANTVQFLSVGRFTIQKNLQISVKALSNIENYSFIYKIYGDGGLKELIEESKGNCQKIQLRGTVSRSEILQELANASMVIMPSRWEGLSIFMLEAMAFDCPLMISDVPSLRNVVQEKPLDVNESWRLCDWGYLVKVDDVKGYEAAALHYLSHTNLEKQFREKVNSLSQKYDIHETANKYLIEYQKVLQEKN